MPYAIVFAFATILALGAAAHGENKVRAEIIPGVQSVKPGDSFEIAVRFVIDDGWHMYWTNPGDSGLPPSVKWQTPEGVSVGELRFPAPHRIKSGEGLISYGYENELVLLATVTTTRDVTGPIRLNGAIDWLVCKDVCLTESQPADATVAVGDEAKARSKPDVRFAAWREQMPEQRRIEVKSERSGKGEGVLIVPLTDELATAKNVEFFGGDAEATYEKGETVQTDKGPALKVQYRRYDEAKTSAPALIAYTDAKTGKRRAVEFTYTY